ncbi:MULTISPECIES: hypothetical protein [Agrobacterium]|uniref:hypothetical protein n=1 Tax=Agrobacterium TaxID=357 RepID=UPI0022B80F1E|nr:MULTISPECIES: hypothetical protein [Agrobacterium]MCZ7888833.1 hypothetical protein [Agrobacterium salinitolerans]MDA5627681.1 hypothetical protein [Agrobacterium sp. ST15.16.055]MDA5639954.1 hypothetical protein [Agrobacterium sp. ST15.13.013]MDA6978570.1 hypothetical protein [Agrobacterium salinitolerans]MDA6999914.1 hypothetical protein [Agrobacterium salinitolerans]
MFLLSAGEKKQAADARFNATSASLLNQYLIKTTQRLEEIRFSVTETRKTKNALPDYRKGHCSKTGLAADHSSPDFGLSSSM